MKRWSNGLLILLVWLVAAHAHAQPYPNKPVKLIVPFPAGSGPDQVGRILARQFQEKFSQTFVVENRSGALGVAGATEVAHSRPDGYTLLMGTNSTQAANVSLFKALSYDPVKDFAPVALIAAAPMVMLVRPDFPAHDIKAFVKEAQQRKPSMSGGYGSAASQIAIAKLNGVGGTSISIPYRGTPPQLADLLAGQIDYTFADMPTAMPMIASGRLRTLGLTSLKRVAFAPDIPALAETYPGFEVSGWHALLAPAETPPAIVERLHQALVEILAMPAVQADFKSRSLDLSVFLGPAKFAEFNRGEIAKWRKDLKEAGIEPQ